GGHHSGVLVWRKIFLSSSLKSVTWKLDGRQLLGHYKGGLTIWHCPRTWGQ
ncbi:unnamed protein product, partial [Staurois parvus]